MSSREVIFAFFLSLAVISGPAIHTLFENDLSQVPDTSTYLAVARLDFDESPVRRYRVIIPFAAAFIDYTTGFATERLAPSHFKGDFSLAFSFFLVNTLLIAVLGGLTYGFCRAYGIDRKWSVIGLLVLLTSRYTSVFAALPLVDSLFCVAVAAALLGVKTRNTALIIAAVFIGPLARESFIFVVPVLFFSHIRRLTLTGWLALSGFCVVALHLYIDRLFPPGPMGWVNADLSHINNVGLFLPMLFSFQGIYKMLINLGWWTLIPVFALVFVPAARAGMKRLPEPFVLVFLVSVLVQMLLSGSMERMFYQALPVFSVLVAFSAEKVWSAAGPGNANSG